MSSSDGCDTRNVDAFLDEAPVDTSRCNRVKRRDDFDWRSSDWWLLVGIRYPVHFWCHASDSKNVSLDRCATGNCHVIHHTSSLCLVAIRWEFE
jgi:hypothetical protein